MYTTIVAQRREIKLKQKYLDVDLPDSRLVVNHSPMGSGKSTWITKNVGGRGIFGTHRVCLGAQIAKKNKAAFYKEIHGEIKADRFVISVDSLPRLLVENQQPYDTLVIDEYGQFFRHLKGETCARNRHFILRSMQYAANLCRQIILLDAHEYPEAVAFFQSLCGIDKLDTTFITNNYNNVDKVFKEFTDRKVILAAIKKSAAEGKKIFVACDTQSQVVQLEGILRKVEGLRVITVHGDNSRNEEQVRLIENVNEVQKEYDVLIASPSLSTGIDISEPHFDEVYLIARRHKATHRDLMQSCSRVRPVKTINFWINPVVTNLSEDPKAIRRVYEGKVYELITELRTGKEAEDKLFGYDIDPLTGRICEKEPAYFDFVCALTARENKSLNNLRENFIEEAETLGRVVQAKTPSKKETAAIGEELSQVDKENEETRIEKTKAARDITEDEKDALSQKDSRTLDERYELDKFRSRELCGHEESLLEETIEKYSEGLYKTVKLQGYRRASNEDLLTKDAHDVEWYLETDWEFRLATKSLMRVLEMCLHPLEGTANFKQRESVIDAGRLITADDLQRFAEHASFNRDKIKLLLGLTVPVDVRKKPMQFFKSYLQALGYDLVLNSQPRVNGKQVRQYTITNESMQFTNSIMVARLKYTEDCRQAERIDKLVGIASPF